MPQPQVVTAEEWHQARDELLKAEKNLTHASDALAARRRRLPMVRFGRDYVFEGPAGRLSLLDLFDSRQQLVVYQFMDVGPDDFCPGCTNFTNTVANLASVNSRGITFVNVSNMPLSQIEAYKQRMGWSVPFVSSRGSFFSDNCGAGDGFGLSVFLRDADEVYRTYFTTGRGVDHLLFDNNIFDLTPFGRQEAWEDSPPGWPQDAADW
ncbi:MAG: DUF899 domain-containing protein [Nocardioidaceae bacterium]